ncbi:hypothetical protein GMOD_00008170 [Pyrenophora seminiperda CCB06]|uniref:Uncharacterized protein n=1 Tax=Pyrenophora seminiperda CCB06 TaxID=1302712 RepID=A0A3M7M240_9PLEO|nr:hypothetical protein GMOD_00008170 [Pyrenophora seminiperda CCB06]
MASTNPNPNNPPSMLWNPQMTYLPGSLRPPLHPRTLLEQYADESILTFYRAYKPHRPGNYNHDTDISTTIRISNAIDLVDSNPLVLDQIIWGMTHPHDANPGVQDIIEMPVLVDILLVRHFRRHGGLVLPPLEEARKVVEVAEVRAVREKAEGLRWGAGRELVRYPNWRDWRDGRAGLRGGAGGEGEEGKEKEKEKEKEREKGMGGRGRGRGRGRGGARGGY